MQRILTFVTCMTRLCLRSLHHRFILWTEPDTTSLIPGMLIDQARSKSELVAENAFLRKPLIILRRQVKRSACTKTDRMLLVLLASMVRTWKQALFIIQEDDEARGGIVRASSSFGNTSPGQHLLNRSSPQRLWGAERIRGELLKLGIRVCKRTIEKYMRAVCTTRPGGQTWKTFLPVTDLFFHSRRVIHVGVTRSPTDAWTARTAAGGHCLWHRTEVSHP